MRTCDRLDESALVWLAAVAADRDPLVVLADADMGALARVVADVEDAGDALDRAATVAVAIVTHEPFAVANRAAAWAAAAHVAADDGHRLRLGADEVVAMLAGVARQELGPDEVRRALERSLPGRGRPTGAWRCPECGRPLYADESARRAAGAAVVCSTRFELVARCSWEHGAHDRLGRPLPTGERGEPERWVPITAGGAGRWFVALVDGNAVAFVPAPDDDDLVDVFVVRDPDPAMLVGGPDRAVAAGEQLGAIATTALRFDGRGGALDWHHLVEWADAELAARLDRDRAHRLVPA